MEARRVVITGISKKDNHHKDYLIGLTGEFFATPSQNKRPESGAGYEMGTFFSDTNFYDGDDRRWCFYAVTVKRLYDDLV